LFGGEGGVCAPPPPYCDGQPKKPLPYNIIPDFNNVAVIGPEHVNFTIISNPDCNAATFPTPPPPAGAATDAGDAGDVASADAGDDGSAADAAPEANADAIAEAATVEGAADAAVEGGPPPACFEFLYNPSCLMGTMGLCWSGVIFQNIPVSAGVATKSTPGVCISPGATAVTFWARSSRNGTVIKFGSTKEGQCTNPRPAPYDPAAQQMVCPGSTEFFLPITTQWQQYVVSLPAGEPYDNENGNFGGVWKAFSAVVEPQDYVDDAGATVGTYILVKDIRWVASVPSSDAGGDAVSSDATDGSDDAPASQ
jgi:hypothetical protein